MVPNKIEKDLTYLYDKHPSATDSAYSNKHKDATKTFDYTAITDQSRTVSWGRNSQKGISLLLSLISASYLGNKSGGDV